MQYSNGAMWNRHISFFSLKVVLDEEENDQSSFEWLMSYSGLKFYFQFSTFRSYFYNFVLIANSN